MRYISNNFCMDQPTSCFTYRDVKLSMQDSIDPVSNNFLYLNLPNTRVKKEKLVDCFTIACWENDIHSQDKYPVHEVSTTTFFCLSISTVTVIWRIVECGLYTVHFMSFFYYSWIGRPVRTHKNQFAVRPRGLRRIWIHGWKVFDKTHPMPMVVYKNQYFLFLESYS